MTLYAYLYACLIMSSLSHAMENTNVHHAQQPTPKQQLGSIVAVAKSVKESPDVDQVEPEFINVDSTQPGMFNVQVRRKNPKFKFESKYYYSEEDRYGCRVLRKRVQ